MRRKEKEDAHFRQENITEALNDLQALLRWQEEGEGGKEGMSKQEGRGRMRQYLSNRQLKIRNTGFFFYCGCWHCWCCFLLCIGGGVRSQGS